MTDPEPHTPPSSMDVLKRGLQAGSARIISAGMLGLAHDEDGGGTGTGSAQATLESIQKNLPLLLDELALLLPEVMAGRATTTKTTLPAAATDAHARSRGHAAARGLECHAEHRLDVVVKLLQGISETFVLEISRLKDTVAEDFLARACREIRRFFAARLAACCVEFVTAQDAELARRTAQLKEAQEQLRAAPEHARAAAHSRAQLLQGVTHELRNSLQTVLLYASSLTEEDDDAGWSEVAEKLALNAVHLQKLLDRIQACAPILADGGRNHLSQVDLRDFLAGLEQRHRMLARAAQTRLICQMATDCEPATLITDLAKLSLIADHLIGNAIHAAHSGWVRIEIAADGPERILLKVADSGKGISLEEARQMFRVIHHAPGATFQGLRLGLLASRHLAHLLGGDITFQSEHGQGAAFTLSLPRTAVV